MPATLDPAPALAPLIPDALAIRKRIYQLRTEANLLVRLLRIAEDKAKVLPPHLVGPAVAAAMIAGLTSAAA